MATEYKLSYTGAQIDEKLGKVSQLETTVSGKANASHTHKASEVTDLGSLATKSTVAKTDLDTTVQNSLNKADSALQSYTETDPTVPAWAKASTKPTYNKSEVGLGNVDNVKQYSANNPPPYPVTSVNGQTGAVTLNAASVGARPSTWTPSATDVGAATAEQFGQLSKEIADQQKDINNKAEKTDIPDLTGYATETYVKDYAQPKGDYVKTVNGQRPDTSGNVTVTAQAEQPNFVDSIDEMTDTEKAYVLKSDGMIYTYSKKTTVVPGSNFNVFDKTTATINGRLNSSGTAASATVGSKGCFITDFIELTNWGSLSAFMVRVNFELQSIAIDANQAYFYDESKTFIPSYVLFNSNAGKITIGDGKTTFDLKQLFSNSSAKFVKLRLYKNVSGTAIADADLNDVEILFDANQTEDTVVDAWGWYSTGLSYSQSDNEERIASLENNVNDNTVDITLLKKRVTNLESDDGTLFIPEWWENEVADTITKIKAAQVGKNCVTFPFFSDNHQRNGYAGVLIAKIMKECGIPYAFYGGDAISSGLIPDEATMIAQDKAFDEVMSYIPYGRFCRAVGNHDGFWKVSSTESHWYTREQVYELFLREESTAQNKHFGEDGTYYYINDSASKVRWIVLNIHSVDVDATQIAWFRDVALKFDESGWAVVIISHAPITRHYATLVYNAEEVRTVLKDYINGSSENKADVVGWWTGHVHRDRIFEGVAANPGYDGSTNTEEDMANGDPIAEVLPWKTVTIISDNVYIGYGGVKHPINESDQSHAIDFVTINKATRTVKITRLGFGSDRSFTY